MPGASARHLQANLTKEVLSGALLPAPARVLRPPKRARATLLRREEMRVALSGAVRPLERDELKRHACVRL